MALRRVSQAGRRRGGAPVGSASGSPESANLRYLIACAALLTMAACLPVTWLCVGHDRVPGARGAAEAPEVWSSRSAVTTALTTEREGYTARSPAVTGTDTPRWPSADSPPLSPSPLTGEGRGEGVAEQDGVHPLIAATWLDRISTALPWLVIAWLVGVFGLSMRLAIGWRGASTATESFAARRRIMAGHLVATMRAAAYPLNSAPAGIIAR